MISQFRGKRKNLDYVKRRKRPVEIKAGKETGRLISFDVYIAALAVVISFITLVTTYDGQRLDRFYREVAIRPRLTGTYSDDNNGISVRNDGTGPAIISEISLRGIGKGYSPYPDVPNLEEGQSRAIRDRVKFQRDVAAALYRTFGNVGTFNPYRHVKFSNWSVYSLTHGSQRDLLKIDLKGMIEEIDLISFQLPLESRIRTKKIVNDLMPEIFSRHALLICYCSITYNFCTTRIQGSASDEDVRNDCSVRGEEYISIYDHLLNTAGFGPAKADPPE